MDVNFKNPLKISDILKGAVFEVTNDEPETLNLDEETTPDMNHKLPASFTELKSDMFEVAEGILKKFVEKPQPDATKVNFLRHRITYHRMFFTETGEFPFDSTHGKGEPDEICLPLKDKGYLDGLLEALETMKEGEHSQFIIGYEKMFKEFGCPPLIKPRSDIFCDLKILKLDDIGKQEEIDKVLDDENENKFSEVKIIVDEMRLRAKDLFGKGKFDQAIQMYRKMLQKIELSSASDDGEAEERRKMLILVKTNLVICFNKKNRHSDAISLIRSLEALGAIGGNAKLLYNQGVALMGMSENRKAGEALTKAARLNPANEKIIEALNELEKRKSSYDSFVKKFKENLKLGK